MPIAHVIPYTSNRTLLGQTRRCISRRNKCGTLCARLVLSLHETQVRGPTLRAAKNLHATILRTFSMVRLPSERLHAYQQKTGAQAFPFSFLLLQEAGGERPGNSLPFGHLRVGRLRRGGLPCVPPRSQTVSSGTHRACANPTAPPHPHSHLPPHSQCAPASVPAFPHPGNLGETIRFASAVGALPPPSS